MTRAERQERSPLQRQLERELRWLRARIVGHALLAAFGSVSLILAVAVVTAPGWTHLGPAGAWILWSVLVGVVAFVAYFDLWRPLSRVRGIEPFSHELEQHGAYDNLLEAATQFESGAHADPVALGASRELVREVVRRAAERAAAVRLSRSIPLSGAAQDVGVALIALVAWFAIAGLGPERFDRAFGALGDPSSLATPTPLRGVHAETRDLRVPVGTDLTLAARDFTALDEPAFLEINRTGDFWQQEEVEEFEEFVDGIAMRRLQARLEDVVDPFRYRFRRGTVVGPVFSVEVRQRPVVRTVRLYLEPPAYTERASETLVDPAGVISVLEGTRIVLEGEASAELRSAERVDEESGVAHPLHVEATAFADTFEVTTDLGFRLRLVDEDGLASDAVTTYRFVAVADEAPTVQILEPGEDLMLERDLRVTIEGLAADDVGLARVDLVHRQELDTEWTRVPLVVDGKPVPHDESVLEPEYDFGALEVGVRFVWDLGDLALLPGDGVVYALEATDDNARVGGQVTRSRSYRLRLPTIAEVFDLEREERASESDDLQDLLADGQELKEDLERLRRELLKDPDPDWTKKEEIRETLERQQELREKLQDSVGDLQQQMEEFQRNNAGSMELLEKMETIEELLEELKDDESLQAYLEAMREAMDQLSPQEIQRQMEDSLADQEEYNRRLDRTIQLLEQLERERRMSDLVEETNEYLRRQEQIAELTEPEPEPEQENEVDAPTEDSERSPADDENGSEDQESGDRPESESGQDREPSDAPSDQHNDEAQSELEDEELARMQKKLAEEMKDLEERLKQELERMEQEQKDGEQQPPSAEEMKKALEKALEQMEQQQPSEPMEQAQEELSEGDRQEAQEQQDEARRRLLALYEILMQGESMMQKAQGKWAGEKLQQTAFDLLELSHREEVVFDALRDGVRGQNMRPLTREQSRVHRATAKLSDDLHELARQDFAIRERLLATMRDLVLMIEETVDELNLARPTRSRTGSQEVMAEMNTLVISLLTAAKNAQGGGGGAGMPSPSQQMRQMAEEQSRLNGMTQDLKRKLEHGMSSEERRQLAEMKARQQAIREQLEKLREQIDDERRVLGDLDDLTESMETVEEDLGAGRLDDETQKQQEKILSRLLDAERSVRERDFAKRRESKGSEKIFTHQEGLDAEEDGSERESALRRFQALERAPRAYREDVRRYFRSIQRELEAQREGQR